MQLNKNTNKDREKAPSKMLKILLFWSIFLFVIFLGKRFTAFPKGNFDFLIKNILSFASAAILSGAMLHFLSIKSLRLSIPIIWVLTVLLIVV